MQVESLKEVLEWTRDVHQYLSSCLQQFADQSDSEGNRKWLDYLSEHEAKLALLIADISENASENALNTWCYDYLDKRPLMQNNVCRESLSKLTRQEIVEVVSELHQQVLELYLSLHSRVGAPSAKELIKQLIDLEDHEALLLTQNDSQ